MSLRRKIALWLCPELKQESDESWRFRAHVQDYQHWLGMFPEAAQVLKSLRATVLGSEPINAGTPAGDEVCTIGGLREQLFRMKEMRPADQVGERIIPAAGNKACMVVAGYRPSAEEFANSPPNYSGGL
ncbi:hypothetical protein [Comamonas koreensis]|uniref:hypothetical protein n=1 Tax=Comamonas koreensis TaxID=160825 RepID=UPI0015F8AF43|nr:hypothetical protein [Comamonas koreensis]